MTKEIHLFDNYCNLYKRLCKEANIIAVKCNMMSDRQLLEAINRLLKRFGCIEMTEKELDMELD
jgi:ABC-type Na+ transport system ATPase subunit NatA